MAMPPDQRETPSFIDKVLYSTFQLLPRNLMSFVVGALARIRWPGPISTIVNKIFVSLFRIKMDEAELPLKKYRSIEDVFSRALKPGARVIQGEPCMPCDGTLVVSSPSDGQSAVQIKGINYSLFNLVFAETNFPSTTKFAWYTTIYLAPHNYHRVHSPVSGRLLSIHYVPGDLWPVNPPFVRIIPALFNKNERLIFEIGLNSSDDGKVYVVMVGALNVGRITSPWFADLVTNSLGRQFVEAGILKAFKEPPELKAGDELGAFLLGSTAVVVFDDKARARFNLTQISEARPVVLGQPL